MTPKPQAIHRNLVFCQISDPGLFEVVTGDPILAPKIVAHFEGGVLAVRRTDEDSLVAFLNKIGVRPRMFGRWLA